MLTSTFFDDFNAMRRDMDRLFGSLDVPVRTNGEGWVSAPVFDSGWTDDHLNLRFVLPGVPEDSVDMTMQGNHLVISGEWPAPDNFSNDGARSYRLPYGKFERKIDLPNGLDTDHIEAHLHHGLLDIRIPIAEAMKPKKIEIQSKVEGGKKTAKIAA